ncbi:MAG: WD40/YVTN/BNR-like repeat-containing protein, partial [Planctomycetota bacterium]
TFDGGQTWDVGSCGGTTIDLHGISFPQDQAGLVAGEGGVILHTFDWGETWTVQESGTFENLFAVTCVDPNVAFSAGTQGAILGTSDGGGLALHAEKYEFSVNPNELELYLNAGAVNAGRTYILVGSVTGTSPGYPLPGGLATLPLNFDPFFEIVIILRNTTTFQNFQSTLDGSGQSTAVLNNPYFLPPGYAGAKLYFAYALAAPWDYVSNAVVIEFVD